MKPIANHRRPQPIAGILLAGLVGLVGSAAAIPAQAQAAGTTTPSASACPAEEAVTDESGFPDPTLIPKVSQDPFYQPPAGYAACPKGYVLRSRKVNAMWGLSALSTDALSTLVNVLQQIPIAGPFLSRLPIINDIAKNLKLDAYQLLFRSTDSHDLPIAAVTTVVIPQGGIWKIYADRLHLNVNLDRDWNAPTPSRPLVSFQTDQDDSNLDDAPSYIVRVGWANTLLNGKLWVTPPPEAAIQSIPELLNVLGIPGFLWFGPELVLNTQGKLPKVAVDNFEFLLGLPALLEGYAVAFPDHEGPQGTFINGKQGGQIVMDGIRAALNYRSYPASARIDATSKAALWGYSGGAAHTQWAVEVAGSYAPDLVKNNLVGASIGAAPTSDLAQMVDYNKSKLTIGFPMMGINGLLRAFPEYKIDEVLNEQGKAIMAEAGNYGTIDGIIELLAKWLDQTNGDTPIEYYTIDPSRSVNSWPGVIGVERANSINFQPSQAGAPRIPTLIYHDQQDGLVPVVPEDTWVRKYCKEGSPVQVMRINTSLPSINLWLLGQIAGKTGKIWQLIARDGAGALVHILGEATGDLPALNYLSGRFNGVAARNDCGQIPYPTNDNNPPGQWKGLLWSGQNAPWEPQPGLFPGTTSRSAYRVFDTN